MVQSERKIALARKLRKAMTEPERLLWARLKDRRDRVVFKRQHAIGPYILDFFCHKAQLIIEVDGAMHGLDGGYERDEQRDAYFAGLGMETYRIPAGEVYRNADAVADGIRLMVDELLSAEK